MKKVLCIILAIVTLSFPAQISAEKVEDVEEIIINGEHYIVISNDDIISTNDDIAPCFTGVITKCINPDCEGKSTVVLVCAGSYADTLKNKRECTVKSHTNCEVTIERYYATGKCNLCGQGYVLAHSEYAIHSNGPTYHICYYC